MTRSARSSENHAPAIRGKDNRSAVVFQRMLVVFFVVVFFVVVLLFFKKAPAASLPIDWSASALALQPGRQLHRRTLGQGNVPFRLPQSHVIDGRKLAFFWSLDQKKSRACRVELPSPIP